MNSTWESLRRVGVPAHLIVQVYRLTSARPLTKEELERRPKKVKESER